MEKNWGKCVNIDNCKKAKSKEILEVDSLNFICPECKQPLIEVPEPVPVPWWVKYGKIIGISAAALAIAGGAFVFLGKKGETTNPATDTLVNVEKIDLIDQVSLTKGDTEQLTMTVEPENAKDTYVWKSSNEQVATVDSRGIVTAVGKGESQITVALAHDETISDVCKCKVSEPSNSTKPNNRSTEPKSSLNGHGKVDLGYGTYVGDLKSGKPHGHGTITYKTAHKIVDSKDFVAQPGDEFEGDFRNGRISSIGYWKHNGNQTAIKP